MVGIGQEFLQLGVFRKTSITMNWSILKTSFKLGPTKYLSIAIHQIALTQKVFKLFNERCTRRESFNNRLERENIQLNHQVFRSLFPIAFKNFESFQEPLKLRSVGRIKVRCWKAGFIKNFKGKHCLRERKKLNLRENLSQIFQSFKA